jgi:hypothetical protein
LITFAIAPSRQRLEPCEVGPVLDGGGQFITVPVSGQLVSYGDKVSHWIIHLGLAGRVVQTLFAAMGCLAAER